METYLDKCRGLVDSDLERFLSSTPVSQRLLDSMTYSLFAGGKRVRPALAFAACEAVGGTNDQALPVASALEMIHTYSLIHDDLPAMDNDDLRRGRPTNHKVYGDAIAILAGDGLLTEAFLRLTDPKWAIPSDRKTEIIRVIAQGSGANGMVGGQALDLLCEGKKVDEATLMQIHRAKTGALLSSAVVAGGLAGGAAAAVREKLETYGKAIGLAFQIADDLLDVTGTTAELGKTASKDKIKEKVTYPSVLGVEESRRRAAELLETALMAVSDLGTPANSLTMLARFIVTRSR